MTGDYLTGMFLCVLLLFALGGGVGSYLLQYWSRSKLKTAADLTAAAVMLAWAFTVAAELYTLGAVAVLVVAFLTGVGAADSPPETDTASKG